MTLETDRGNIVLELYPEVAPKTVANFEKLSKDGFYNNLTFHRVEPASWSRAATPLATAPAAPDTVPGEISPTEKHLRGTLAMARTGDNVNPERKSSGSQFYICLGRSRASTASTPCSAASLKAWKWSIRLRTATR